MPLRRKRPLLHLAFWLVYQFQDTLLIYLADTSRLRSVGGLDQTVGDGTAFE